MGFIFGGSTAQNEDEIEKLEQRIDELESETRSLQLGNDNLHSRLNDQQQRIEQQNAAAAKLADVAQSLADTNELEDKEDVVETLDEPKVVWKATRNYVAKLLLPEGATVVHPVRDNRGFNATVNKKRTDEAIVCAFYEVNLGFGENEIKQVALDDVDLSRRTDTFEYEIGEVVEPRDDLDTNTDAECTDGVHFFCTVDEAIYWL